MIYETVGDLSLQLISDSWFAILAFSLVGVLAVLGESNADKEEIKERLASSVRAFVNLVSYAVDQRASKKDEKKDDGVNEGQGESNESAPSDDAKSPSENDAREAKQDRPPRRQTRPGGGTINGGFTWPEDYWNYEDDSDETRFESDEDARDDEGWKDDDEEEEQPLDPRDRKWNDREESDDEVQDQPRPKPTSRFYGKFFRNRNYPELPDPDAPVEDDPDAPRRWRKKKDAPKNDDWDATISDDELDLLFNGDGSDEGGDESDYSLELEYDDEIDFDFLNSPTTSPEEAIDYLRKRVENGDVESRDELIRELMQRVSEARADEQKIAFDALDEIEALLNESPGDAEADQPFYDDSKDELYAQVLLQRAVFYLRNNLRPPIDVANRALNWIRQWADDDPNPKTRRLLATAWQVRASCLKESGSDSAALASLFEAKALFEELTDSGVDETIPSLGATYALMGETYMSIGDERKAIDAYRVAIETFDKYADQEIFLAQKVNYMFRLSSALRQIGAEDESDRVLEEAIEGEERLHTLDEDSYFGPLTQLLEVRADVFAQHGKHEDAIALLDRAIATLEQFLTYDSLTPRRVLAYSHMTTALCRRATIYYHMRRYALVARDLEKSVEFLSLAAKKDDDYDPIIQATIINSLLYVMCASQGARRYLSTLRAQQNLLFNTLSPEELRHIKPFYGQMLYLRANFLSQANLKIESLAAINESIKMLTAPEADDDASPDSLVMLARAFVFRGAELGTSSLSDFRNAKDACERYLETESLDDYSKKFYIRLLRGKAPLELKDGNENVAADDVKTAVSLAVSALRDKRWSYFEELSFLARESIMFFSADGDPLKRFRATKLWLRFAERVRRSYVESEWDFDDDGNELPRNRAFLIEYESFVADVRMFRSELLTVFDWRPEFGKYVDWNVVKPSETSEADETSGENDGPFSIAKLKLLSRPGDRDAFVGKRYRVVTERMKDDPASLAAFCDLDYCLRLARRRVFEGEFRFGQTLFTALERLTDFYENISEPVLGIVEINETARLFDDYRPKITANSGENRGDALFWSCGYRVWDLQAKALDLFCQNWTAIAEADESNLTEDKEFRQTLNEHLKARTEHAYLQSLLALKNMSTDESYYPVWVASSYSRYYQWLERFDRHDEALEIVRAEGELLEKRAKKPTPTALLATSLFYESISSVALDARRVDAAKWALFKLKDSLSYEESLLGRRAIVGERFARMYARFAAVARTEGQNNEAIDQVRKSLDRLATVFERGQAQTSAFSLLCEGICFLFSSGNDQDKQVAARRYKLAERYYLSLSASGRLEISNDFWRASVAVLEWESVKRCCCRRAGQIVDHFKDYCKPLVGEDPGFFVFKRINANFFRAEYGLRFSKLTQSREATRDVVELLEEHYRQLKSRTFPLEKLANDPEANAVSRQLVAALSFEIMIDFFLGDRLKSSIQEVETGLDLARNIPEVKAIFEPRKSRIRYRFERFCENWKKRKGSQALLKESGESPEATEAEKIPFWSKPKEWKRRFHDFLADVRGMWKDEGSQMDAAIFKACFYFMAYKAASTFELEGPRAGSAAFNDVFARVAQIYGPASAVELTCRFIWVDELIRERRWSDAIRETRRAFNVAAKAKEVEDDMDSIELNWRLNCLRLRALAFLERRRFGDLRAAEKIVDQALQKCRLNLRRGLLTLRGSYYELLLLRARLDALRGKKEDALRMAERIKRALDASTKRGIKILTGDSIKSLDDLTSSLKQ
ncbi:MAG: hypothetical protein IK077_06480 [Thermoguttaceae bacterium]|nr:hypothetical protein [Thermoguttaceae bacterium]